MRSNIARTCPASSVPAPDCGRACTARYFDFDSDRNSTIASNFFGGRFLNDGIGAVGFTSVRAIAWAGNREPMCVSSGPGPLLPLSPILWQASQPDWATTALPALYSASRLPPACWTAAGVDISIAVGEPALAP